MVRVTCLGHETGSGTAARVRKGIIMSDLVVIAFPSEAKAEEVRQKILELQKEYLIELGDAAIAVKQPNGTVKLNQLVNTTAAGAVSGTLWGTLVGLIFLMPLVGAAIGAASGAIGGALTDVGVNDTFMKEVAQDFAVRRRSAVFADPQADDGQGAGGFERRRRNGFADLLRPYEGGGVARGARRGPSGLAATGQLNREGLAARHCPRKVSRARGFLPGECLYSPKRCSTISRRCGARRCSNR